METCVRAPLWRNVQKKNFRKLADLIEFLCLEDTFKKQLQVHKHFPLNLPFRLAEKIEKNNPNDPLFLQFVPLQTKQQDNLNFKEDPVEDAVFKITPRLIHKYQGRVLWLSTGACAMHCRYCFRQNHSYPSSRQGIEAELDYLNQNRDIKELILSGGDPLSLGDAQLQDWIISFNQIPHLEVIRFHTRFPIGIPERVTPDLLQVLKSSKKQIVMVFHINHAKELDEDIFFACRALGRLGIPLLVQSVLLKGVNDDVSSLKDLFQILTKNALIPYYLHMLDLVKGSADFFVEEQRALELMESLRCQLPGYALPKLVREIPHKPYKTPIF